MEPTSQANLVAGVVRNGFCPFRCARINRDQRPILDIGILDGINSGFDVGDLLNDEAQRRLRIDCIGTHLGISCSLRSVFAYLASYVRCTPLRCTIAKPMPVVLVSQRAPGIGPEPPLSSSTPVVAL